MAQRMMIDHTPSQINHDGLVAGTAWDVAWEFGDDTTPDDLTGKAVRLIVAGQDVTPVRQDAQGTIRYRPTAMQTAAFQRSTLSVIVLIDGVPEAMGMLRIVRWVTP